MPLKTKKIIINHELYFSKESKTWNKGGVAFLINKANPKKPTFGKMYLITKKQFKEVVKQENNGVSAGFKFKKVIANGSKIILKYSWYGRIINLGNHKGFPIFTFTNSNNLVNTNKPSKAYLKTILKGIQSTHKVDHQVLSTYTKRLNGTKEITPRKIKRLLK